MNYVYRTRHLSGCAEIDGAPAKFQRRPNRSLTLILMKLVQIGQDQPVDPRKISKST